MPGPPACCCRRKGYLQRLREICDRHGILLIFDEVITGFGRLGAPFAATRFGVTPDLMTVAKGLTNGSVPMGAVFARSFIHDVFMNGPEHLIEFFHGYTYSGHPLACAAALGTLETYADEDLLTRAQPDGVEPGKRGAWHARAAQRHRHPQHRDWSPASNSPRARANPASARSRSSSTAGSTA